MALKCFIHSAIIRFDIPKAKEKQNSRLIISIPFIQLVDINLLCITFVINL